MLPGPFLSFFNPKEPSWPRNQLPGGPALCGGRGLGVALRLQAVAPGTLPLRPYCVLFRPVLACQTSCSRPPNGPFHNRAVATAARCRRQLSARSRHLVPFRPRQVPLPCSRRVGFGFAPFCQAAGAPRPEVGGCCFLAELFWSRRLILIKRFYGVIRTFKKEVFVNKKCLFDAKMCFFRLFSLINRI